MRAILTALHGAYCLLCTCTREEANDVSYIRDGFKIDRSIAQLLDIANRQLHLPEFRRKGDYSIRQGLTQVPITLEDLLFISPLHS